ncbi:MAG: 3-isopropylmalate dehydratase [Candidatus Thorarchaeota archaeon]
MSAEGNLIKGKVKRFGNDINTDQIIQGRYLKLLDYDEMAKHTFEVIRPDFASSVEEGDIVVGGRNFGSGSSREEAPMVLKVLGIGCIIAESFSRIFYRNAFNIGLPALVVPNISEQVTEGNIILVDLQSGKVIIMETGMELHGDRIPERMLELLKAGGAIPWFKKHRA